MSEDERGCLTEGRVLLYGVSILAAIALGLILNKYLHQQTRTLVDVRVGSSIDSLVSFDLGSPDGGNLPYCVDKKVIRSGSTTVETQIYYPCPDKP